MNYPFGDKSGDHGAEVEDRVRASGGVAMFCHGN